MNKYYNLFSYEHFINNVYTIRNLSLIFKAKFRESTVVWTFVYIKQLRKN